MSCSGCPERNADSISVHLHQSVQMNPQKMFSVLIAQASLIGLTTLLPGAMLVLIMIQTSRPIHCGHNPSSKEFVVYKTNKGQEKAHVIGIYRWGHEAQRGINISRQLVTNWEKHIIKQACVTKKRIWYGRNPKFHSSVLCLTLGLHREGLQEI